MLSSTILGCQEYIEGFCDFSTFVSSMQPNLAKSSNDDRHFSDIKKLKERKKEKKKKKPCFRSYLVE